MPVIDSERYEIDPQPLGRGGFGEAYAARDLLFERDVVVKTIVASRLYGMNEPRVRHQFFREALVAARLGRQSDHVVRVLDFGYDRDTDLPFFVMERILGGDLRSEIGKFSWRKAAILLEHLFEALSTAHKNGVIHSDVSPDNVLFDSERDIFKLNDFGLAKLLNSILMSRGASLSLTGGKPGYLPVEQVDTGDRNQYTDVYGTAITIINLVSGNVPRWRFDFASKEMVGPDLTRILETDDLDEIVSEGHHSSLFAVPCPLEGDEWQFRGRYNRASRYADFRVADFIELLSLIVEREISTIDEAREQIRKATLTRLLPREERYREELEIKKEADRKTEAAEAEQRKQAEQEHKQKVEEERQKQLALARQKEQALRAEIEEELREKIRAEILLETAASDAPKTTDA